MILSLRTERERTTGVVFFSGTIGGIGVITGVADEYVLENTSGRVRSTNTKAAIEHNVSSKKNFTPNPQRIDFQYGTDSGTEAPNAMV
jgi:hypothetical protein